jgi:hypothetical protein
VREYKEEITLSRNARGIYSLDTVMGCASGTAKDSKGCYGDCYAARYSKKYGYDFSKIVIRKFRNQKHIESVVRKINKIDMPFVRIGTSGDPSEDWEHTVKILEMIKDCEKDIVIITKHWSKLTESQLDRIKGMNICINTSVSAMDDASVLENGLSEYKRIAPYCKSVLRVVTCDFNRANPEGDRMFKLQEAIVNNYKYIDTVFRVSKNNPLVQSGIINIKEIKFLGKRCNVSKLNKKTFFGKCAKCPEMCGVTV